MANPSLQELAFYWSPVALILSYTVADLSSCTSPCFITNIRQNASPENEKIKEKKSLCSHLLGQNCVDIVFLISSGVRAWLSSSSSEISAIKSQFKVKDTSEIFSINICGFCFVMLFHSEGMHIACTSKFSMLSSLWTPEGFRVEIWLPAQAA